MEESEDTTWWEWFFGGPDAPEPEPGPEVVDPAVLKQREEAAEMLHRHEAQAAWAPTTMAYDVSVDRQGAGLRRAYHVPINGEEASPFDSGNLCGHVLLMHRPVEGVWYKASRFPYEDHFKSKSRRWEIRIQGQFRRKPYGKLYLGFMLQDFDYDQPAKLYARALASVSKPMLEVSMGQNIYLTWGDRCEEAAHADAELAHLVTQGLTAFDQVIVTPAGEEPPELGSDLDGAGFLRNAMALDQYHAKVQEVEEALGSTEDTYTFCFWGCSRFVDLCTGNIHGMGPFSSVSFENFLEEWPGHFTLYALDETEDEPRHLERSKEYLVDLMIWNSGMRCPELYDRYSFLDENPGSWWASSRTGRRRQAKRPGAKRRRFCACLASGLRRVLPCC